MASSLKVWPGLIAARYPHGIPPTYRTLLSLYNAHVSSPAFGPTRLKVLPHLKPFDREGYISALPKPLPEEFETWVQEWPAEAVISWVWPGLDNEFNYHSGWWTDPSQRFDFWRTYGSNKLAAFPPKSITFRLELQKDDPLIFMTANERAKLGYGNVEWNAEDCERGSWELLIQALEIQEHGCAWSTFLLLNGAGKQRNGTVWYVEGDSLQYAIEAMDEGISGCGGKLAYGWVDWLRQEMGNVEDMWIRWRDKRTHGACMKKDVDERTE